MANNKLVTLNNLDKLARSIKNEHDNDIELLTTIAEGLNTKISGIIENENFNTTDKTIIGAINELELEVFEAKANIIALDTYKINKEEVIEMMPCKLYYKDYVVCKEYTSEHLLYSTIKSNYGTLLASFNSKIDISLDNNYKVTIVFADGTITSEEMTTIGSESVPNYGTIPYMGGSKISIYDSCGYNHADGSITGSADECVIMVTYTENIDTKNPTITNVKIEALEEVEVTSEFLETHKFITEEEKTKWNNKINEDKIFDVLTPNNTLNLTTAKRQRAQLNDGTIINLPTVTDFTEIHLYFSTLTDLTLIFPAGKYQKTPEIKANKTYEFIFTYVGEWLIGYIEYGN